MIELPECCINQHWHGPVYQVQEKYNVHLSMYILRTWTTSSLRWSALEPRALLLLYALAALAGVPYG